jgi:molybdopterin synthase catalytic subunit
MIRVQRVDFDIGAELAALAHGKTGIGGLVTFVGLVRDLAGEERVGAMTLEHYPGMTERALAEIEAEARRRWALEDVLIIHRYGRMEPGERIVLVATASAHRQAAFDACQFLIDWLKTKAPFWKLEETPEGPRWVEAQASDDRAAERWEGR